MKKAKATLADLPGLDALRLAREPKAKPTKPAGRKPVQKAAPAEEAPAVDSAQNREQLDQPRPVGRPKTGKRSNTAFHNVTVYIRKQTHADVDELLRRRRRLDQIPPGEPEDVSELVESLLADWLSRQSE